jgi:GABA permease
MARYLVVAHESVSNPKLVEKLKEIAKQDDAAEFVLLVPASPVRHLLLWKTDTATEQEAAEHQQAEGREAFIQAGVNLVATRIGAESPVDAIDQELRENPGYAGLVISTLPKEHSRWLRLGLPEVMEQKHYLPVHHVEATPNQLRAWLSGRIDEGVLRPNP